MQLFSYVVSSVRFISWLYAAGRTEAVLRRLQQRAPVMSDAEKAALSELKDIQLLLSSYTSKIKTVWISCIAVAGMWRLFYCRLWIL